jgi:hypothetical protein
LWQRDEAYEEATEQLARHCHLGHPEHEVAPHRDRHRRHGKDVGLSAAVVAMTTARTVSTSTTTTATTSAPTSTATATSRTSGETMHPAAVLLKPRRAGDASGPAGSKFGRRNAAGPARTGTPAITLKSRLTFGVDGLR